MSTPPASAGTLGHTRMIKHLLEPINNKFRQDQNYSEKSLQNIDYLPIRVIPHFRNDLSHGSTRSRSNIHELSNQ